MLKAKKSPVFTASAVCLVKVGLCSQTLHPKYSAYFFSCYYSIMSLLLFSLCKLKDTYRTLFHLGGVVFFILRLLKCRNGVSFDCSLKFWENWHWKLVWRTPLHNYILILEVFWNRFLIKIFSACICKEGGFVLKHLSKLYSDLEENIWKLCFVLIEVL